MRIGLVVSNQEIKSYELIELENLLNSTHKINCIYSEKNNKKKFRFF